MLFEWRNPTTYVYLLHLGGTVDITVHEKLAGGGLKEISRATGGDCGGTSIDAEFIQLLAKIFGAPLIHTMKREQPEAYLDLIREFETVKRTITASREGKINMTIPYATLDSLCKKHLKEDLPSTLSLSPYANTISIRGDKMRIDADIFKNLFDKTITNILALLQAIFTRKESVSVTLVLLVGGFAECSLLQAKIRKTLLPRRVLVPEESGLTVLKGAVLFGHNSKAIDSRKIRVTYGVNVRDFFNPDKHDQEHHIEVDGVERCRDAFDIIIQKDVTVSPGTTVKKNYASLKGDKIIEIDVYVSENHSPVFIDEDGCSRLGGAEINISDPSKSQDLEVEFMFGNTEVSLQAVEKYSGNCCELRFDLI